MMIAESSKLSSGVLSNGIVLSEARESAAQNAKFLLSDEFAYPLPQVR